MKRTFGKILSAMLGVALLFQTAGAGSLPVWAAAPFSITGLQVEQLENPLGIDQVQPRFSWKMESDQRGIRQAYYQVRVSTDPQQLVSGRRLVWNSEKTAASQSVDILYDGVALESATRYYWNVTVWDENGTAVTSETAWFETGLLSDSDWAAQWIQLDTEALEAAGPHPTSYTIDLDLQILQDNIGIVFAAKDTSDFLMWQLNTHQHGSLYLRPHIWTAGVGSCIGEVEIPTGVVPQSQYNAPHHLTIAVSGSTIVTSLDGIQVDSRTSDRAAYGRIGFRMYQGDPDQEQGAVDNVVVKDGSGQVLFSEDFTDASNPNFSVGQVENGWLRIQNCLGLQRTENDAAPLYRKNFSVSGEVTAARLYATALGLYQARINGQTVGEDLFPPGWTAYEKAQQRNYLMYQTYDVTDLLQSGDNCIGFITGHGWYSGKLFWSGPDNFGTGSKLLAQLVITYADGSTETVGTDGSWHISANGPILSDDFQDGETYDANREKAGWSTASYREDSSWGAPKITSYDGELEAMVGPTVREIQEFTPLSVTQVNPGVWIVNLGQNIAGYARISMTQPAGTKIRLRFGEMLNQDGTLYTENLRSAKATDYYTFRGEADGETWQPIFTFHGFQYVEVTGLQGELTADMITGIAVSSLQETTGSYETSNEKVNQLFSNIVWGQRDNYISVPTDCPQRDERLGYTGDGQVFIRTGSMLHDVCSFARKFMEDILANQRSDGSVADWNPDYITPGDGYSGTYGNSGWGDAICIIPWTVYTAYGDTEILEMSYEGMKKWLAYYQNQDSDRDCIVSVGWYGDWLNTENTEMRVLSTGFWAYDCLLTSKIAAVLGYTQDAAAYYQKYQDISAAFVRQFVGADGTVDNGSQTSQLVALKFQLVEDAALAQKVADKLVENIVARDYHLSTGFLGVAYLCPMLSQYGYSHVAYKLLLQETYPSWLYSVNAGATTIWERWNSYNSETQQFGDVSMNSFNHYSLGSIGEWMFAYSGGIQYDETAPGYQHFVIAPEPGSGLDYVNCTFDSVYGTIVSNWSYVDATTLQMEVTVPANTTATVSVPTVDADSVTESGQRAGAAEGVTFIAYDNGRAIYEVGAGVYLFQSTVEQRQVLVSIADGSSLGSKVTWNGVTYGLPVNLTVPVGTEMTLTAAPLNEMNGRFLSFAGDVAAYEPTVTFTADGCKNILVNTVAQDNAMENLALGGAVTASSSYTTGDGTWLDSNLTDGICTGAGGYTSDAFGGADLGNHPVTLTVDLGAAKTFDAITLYPRRVTLTAGTMSASFPADFTLAISQNGTDWQTVSAQTEQTALPGEARTYGIETVTARYVRLSVTVLGERPMDDGSYRLQLAELAVYHRAAAVQVLADAIGTAHLTRDNAADLLSQASYTQALYAGLSKESQAAVTGMDAVARQAEEARALLAAALPGDMNGDGNLSVTDVVLLRKAILGGSYDPVGDLNGDGALSVTDVVLLRKEILK